MWASARHLAPHGPPVHSAVLKNPEVVVRLKALLEKLVADGRSTPGAPQQNAVPVELRKPIPMAAAKKKAR